jgi:hypothetical protein
VYDEAWVDERSRLIQLAIDARRQKYPNEVPYAYQPYKGRELDCRWDGDTSQLAGFWKKDIVV